MPVEWAFALVAISAVIFVGTNVVLPLMLGQSRISEGLDEHKAVLRRYVASQPSARSKYLFARWAEALAYIAVIAGAPLMLYTTITTGATVTAAGVALFMLSAWLSAQLDHEAAKHEKQNAEHND